MVMGTTHVQGKIYQVSDWNPTVGETGGGTVCTRNELLATDIPVIREIVFPVTEPTSQHSVIVLVTTQILHSHCYRYMRLSCGMTPQSYSRTVSNGMGELSQVTTPTGAVIKYSYSKSSIHNFSMDVNVYPACHGDAEAGRSRWYYRHVDLRYNRVFGLRRGCYGP